MKNLIDHLIALYGNDLGRATASRVAALLERYRGRIPQPRVTGLTARDAILITYGDQVRAPDQAPLQTLADFCATHLRDVVNGIHILPFYPYSSDDGFSIIDYRAVNPALGTWEDIARLRQNFCLMFDLVANHVSAQSEWFQEFLRGNPGYGKNDFHDNGDGTITDLATGLMWSRADSGKGMNWQNALAWVQKINADKFLGHDDWRMPGVKELQSIVDYTHSPDTTRSPAIDPVFDCTTITNEAQQRSQTQKSWRHRTTVRTGCGVAAIRLACDDWPC